MGLNVGLSAKNSQNFNLFLNFRGEFRQVKCRINDDQVLNRNLNSHRAALHFRYH